MAPSRFVMAWLCSGALLAGCGGATSSANNVTLDATSDSSVKASMAAMTVGMSDDEKREFKAACIALASPEAMLAAAGNLSVHETRKPSQAKMYKPLHGLTSAEILAKAAQLHSGK